jgi:DNA-directed RNA polymerase specialized sigma24 family protein
VLKDIVGFSVEQVAQITRTKEATVKTRLHRARLMLRDVMQQHLPTPMPLAVAATVVAVLAIG